MILDLNESDFFEIHKFLLLISVQQKDYFTL
jgi:hypothetical protein